MRANDWAGVAAFFTADAVRMPPNQPMHRGRTAIQQWLSQIERLSNYDVVLEEIHGSGTFAYAHAKYGITLTLKGMSGPIKDSGKAVEVWKKEPDGAWRIASAIWNSDVPLP
jgi:ketosteroid isomerase-like protein